MSSVISKLAHTISSSSHGKFRPLARSVRIVHSNHHEELSPILENEHESDDTWSDSSDSTGSDSEPEIFYSTPTTPAPATEADLQLPTIVVTESEELDTPRLGTTPDVGFLNAESWDLRGFHAAFSVPDRAAYAAELAEKDFTLRMHIHYTHALVRKYALDRAYPADRSSGSHPPRQPTPRPTTPKPRVIAHTTGGVRHPKPMYATRMIEPVSITLHPPPLHMLPPGATMAAVTTMQIPEIVITPPEDGNLPPQPTSPSYLIPDERFLDAHGFDFVHYWRALCEPEQAVELRDWGMQDSRLQRRLNVVRAIAARLDYPTPTEEETERLWQEEMELQLAAAAAAKQRRDQPIARRHLRKSAVVFR
jgi:hypothetical protein